MLLPAHIVLAVAQGHVFSISSVPAEQDVWQQVCSQAEALLSVVPLQTLPEVSVKGWLAVTLRRVRPPGNLPSLCSLSHVLSPAAEGLGR